MASEENKKLSLPKLLIAIAVFLAIACAVFFWRLSMTAEEARDVALTWACLSDAFFVAGILVLGAGGLIWASGEGAFWGIGYAGNSVLRAFVPVFLLGEKKRNEYYSKNGKPETYADYRARKEAKPKGSFLHLLIVGGSGVLLGIVCLLIFKQLSI